MTARPADAKTFHALHAGPAILVLPNAWDALSARVIAEAGAKAVATSSAAVAWAHGYADGHDLPFAKLLATATEIARVISAPLSVDMEGGYADDPGQVGVHVAQMIDVGAVGMNLEDGREAPDLLCRKIEKVREVAARAGVDFFVNARTDVFLKRLMEGQAALAETIARGNLYKAAGADGFFAPGVADAGMLAWIAREVALPLNAMGWKGVPAKAMLEAAGVRRLSAATNMARAAFHALRVAAAAFLEDGDSDALAVRAGESVDYNAWFASQKG